LVSGKLKELYSRPTFVFTRDEQGNYVGSARSIEAFHVTNALTRFNQYFISYGGHHKAAGLTVRAEEFKRFKQEFIAFANETLTEEALVPEIVIDSLVDVDQLNMNTARMIREIGPFGETNAEPLFLLENVLIRDVMLLSNGRHLKVTVQKGSQIFECLWWGGGDYKDDLILGSEIDVVFRMSLNNWQGTERLQLVVEDTRNTG
jgi:single-stranded-DNA-specific exonuclease